MCEISPIKTSFAPKAKYLFIIEITSSQKKIPTKC